jgi:hypothetical protein
VNHSDYFALQHGGCVKGKVPTGVRTGWQVALIIQLHQEALTMLKTLTPTVSLLLSAQAPAQETKQPPTAPPQISEASWVAPLPSAAPEWGA